MKVTAQVKSAPVKPKSKSKPKGKPRLQTRVKREVTKFVKDVADGFVNDAKETAIGLKDAAVGIWKMTAGALIDGHEAARRWKLVGQVAKAIVKHPLILPKALVAPYVDAWKSGHPGDIVGRAAFEILAALTVSTVMHQFNNSLAHAGHILNAAANSTDDIARAASRMGVVAEEVAAHEEEVDKKVKP